MSESANLNPDMTSISWVQEDKNQEDEKEEDILKDKNLEDTKLEDKSPEDTNLELQDGGDGLPEPALSTREV